MFYYVLLIKFILFKYYLNIYYHIKNIMNFINMLKYRDYYYNYQDNKKENVLLLGDGFFARGFLHHINRNKFHITQIYKDEFINPQDLMYSLQRNQIFDKGYHIRDFFYKSPDKKIQKEIKSMKVR